MKKLIYLPTDADLRELGVYSPAMLERLAKERRTYLIEDLFLKPSINIIIGDSGLGKTPLLIQMGICIASGRPFLGRGVLQSGTVLYADFESPAGEFQTMLTDISRFLGLTEVPSAFRVWSPYWSEGSGTSSSLEAQLKRMVEKLEPSLVVVDSLRDIWPTAESKNEEASRVYKFQREMSKCGASFVNVHHVRKPNSQFTPPDLASDPHGWLLEAAGARALINQSDTRLGIERRETNGADLLISGFTRIVGRVAPLYVRRECDEQGFPLGYRALTGVSLLPENYRKAFVSLPESFRFTDAQRLLGGGNSGSNTSNFIGACRSLGLIRHDPLSRLYVKVDSGIIGVAA